MSARQPVTVVHSTKLKRRSRPVRGRQKPQFKGMKASLDANLPRDLAVAFPVGVLLGDDRIVHRRLDLSGGVDRARGDSVLSGRRVWPVERPDLPGVFGLLAFDRWSPASIAVIDLDLDAVDRRAPCRADDAIVRARPG